MDEAKKRNILTAMILASLLLMGALGWYVGRPLIAFASEPEKFRDWVQDKGIWGPALMVGIVIFQVIFALIPGEPFELAAGYAFGGIYGCVLCLIGTTIGGTIVFFLVHKWGTKFLELYFSKEKIESLRFLQDTPRTRSIAFLLMMIPGTPKDLLSYGMGLTRLTVGEWIFISMVARIPSVITSTVCGSAIGQQRYVLAAAVFLGTTALGLLGLWAYNTFSSRHAR